MNRKWSVAFLCFCGGSIGLISASAGFPLTSWQYWVFAFPAAGLLGALWKHPENETEQ